MTKLNVIVTGMISGCLTLIVLAGICVGSKSCAQENKVRYDAKIECLKAGKDPLACSVLIR